MTTEILMLSVEELKKNSTIDMNVEDKILESSILDAQNIDIQAIIGTTLYNSLLTKVYDDTIDASINADYKILLDDFVYPAHLKFALLRSVMPMRVAFRNKGIMQANSENSVPVDKEFITYVESKFRNDADFYANKLKGYLCHFFDKHPSENDTIPTNRNDYSKPNDRQNYFGGLYLG